MKLHALMFAGPGSTSELLNHETTGRDYVAKGSKSEATICMKPDHGERRCFTHASLTRSTLSALEAGATRYAII